MGRAESSTSQPAKASSKPERAKRARETLNKTIPALLASNPRAKHGVDSVEMIVRTESQTSVKDTEIAIRGLHIRVLHTDTLSAATELYRTGKKGAKIATLNMASPLRPGGGFLSGATSQEEFLCMRTTLLPSLQEQFYRLPKEGVVHTPDVLVFRDANGNDLPKAERFYVDVMTAGMLRFPDVEGERYANDADREMAVKKMRAVLRICVAKGVKRVVLGAWGCGAYGNPVAEIALAWRKVILGIDSKGRPKGREVWEDVEEIIFAITDARMVDVFHNCFKGLLGKESSRDIIIEDLQESFRESKDKSGETAESNNASIAPGHE